MTTTDPRIEIIKEALKNALHPSLDRLQKAIEAIDSLEASPMPTLKGWKLVPEEPTEEMCQAGLIAASSSAGIAVMIPLELQTRLKKDGMEVGVRSILYTGLDEYRAMVAAAPEPPKNEAIAKIGEGK